MRTFCAFVFISSAIITPLYTYGPGIIRKTFPALEITFRAGLASTLTRVAGGIFCVMTLIGSGLEWIIDASDAPMPCDKQFDEAMAAGRQHMLTTLAVRAFFESYFARSASERTAHAELLSGTLSSELDELNYIPAPRF